MLFWPTSRVKADMPLQHTATHCNTRRHCATHCNTRLDYKADFWECQSECDKLFWPASRVKADILLQHTATYCQTAPHCTTLLNATCCFGSRVASRQTCCCNTLQHSAPHCTTLHCWMQHVGLVRESHHGRHAAATHCNSLQLTATHCNSLRIKVEIPWATMCTHYGVALVSSIDSMIGLFCKRALWKRLYSAEETYNLIELTNRSHPKTDLLIKKWHNNWHSYSISTDLATT